MVDWNNFASAATAATRTGYSPSHIYTLAKCGEIDARKIANRWIIYVPSVEAYRDSRVNKVYY